MFMVVVLHIFGHGGLLNACVDNSLNYHISWLMEIGAYCAVNTFALTTGYLMFGRKWRIGRIIDLWLQVFFYSAVITLIFSILQPNTVGVKTWIKSLFPVSFKQWWYFTSYFGLFFFIPFLNKILEILSKKQVVFLMIIFLILFSIISTVSPIDTFQLNNGYSLLWLMALYLIGGAVKKFDFATKIKKRWCIILYIGSVFCVWISRIVIRFATVLILGKEMGIGIFVNYLSPFIVLMSLALLLFFSKVNFSKNTDKLLKIISPLSFAVYLIHEQKFIRSQFISGNFAYLAEKNIFVLVGTVLATAIIIFVVCIFIEWLRVLFFKVTGISKMVKKLGNYIDEKIDFEGKK